jgi:alpha-tubulin suppressor-like RCC1 family protein
VRCWGKNDYGQLGNGSDDERSLVPVQVTGLASGVAALASGRHHSCAALATAGVKCWGSNLDGELGIGAAGNVAHAPVDVTSLSGRVSALGAGDATTCAIASGALRCWGRNSDGEIGNGMSGIQLQQPTPAAVIDAGAGVTVTSGGYGSTCAIINGGARCWGSNVNYALGVGRDASFTSTSPVALPGLGSGVTQLAATSTDHGCAVVAGAVKCWGSAGGHLGTGSVDDNALAPAAVVSLP